MTKPGFSLLEVIVAIAILGFVVGIVAVASLRQKPHADQVESTVRAALATGHAGVSRDSSGGGLRYVTGYPSGIVMIDTIRAQDHGTRDDSSSR